MDDIPGLLSRDFGFRAQGKSAPMAASKGSSNIGGGGSVNFGFGSGSGGESKSSSSSFSSNRGKSGWNSTPLGGGGGGSFLDDHEGLFGPSGNKKTDDFEGLGVYRDVFGGPPKYSNQSDARGGVSTDSSFDYDLIFRGSKDSGPKNSSSLPVFDKPVYDDDIFDGMPGLKSSSSVKYEDVFSSISSPSKHSDHFDDLLGNFGKKEPELKTTSAKKSGERENDVSEFDDLIPGFGGSSPPVSRGASETSGLHQPTVSSNRANSSTIEDPFVVLGTSSSVPGFASSGLFSDPLEQINVPSSNSGNSKLDGSSVSGGIFDEMNPLDEFATSVSSSYPSDMHSREKDQNHARTERNTTPAHTSASEESTESASQKKVNVSSKSEENLEAAEDVWLTISEVPLFTQPTTAPPPSRPPPVRTNVDEGLFPGVNTKKKVNEFSNFRSSSQNFQSSKSVHDSVRTNDISSIDELEDFAMGRAQDYTDEHADVLSSEEDGELNSSAAASAAAMKDAMDKAEAKFKHAKEMRDRENAKAAKFREATQVEREEKSVHDAREQELRERQERLEREREKREKEEKEKEEKRLERERERAREIAREREIARQAVERATREARERAAAEARLRAERAAVEKAKNEARERAERAAVQRAQAEARERAVAEARDRALAEARERAAAEARERAEKAAAEARERANAEARERAAVARAEAEVRLRAERAAVERAAAEARERAAAEARERAAAAARENQQKNENDLESFFNMGSRATSAPKARTTTSESTFDTQFQSRTGPEGTRRTSSGTSSGIRKASSTTNIVDDLTSIFGGAPSSGEFQEVDGESEERRRARLDRHQRTQERAAKALAEKNQRDLQVQREQAERHRFAETLDAEIKRWAAGKEGNLRALLSTLQYVLWPECGWQPVSLTDLITGASVKKVYRKATLCIHPDKVQQKGANLQQKYIAEKVFDLLKEAWNKFNSEELF